MDKKSIVIGLAKSTVENFEKETSVKTIKYSKEDIKSAIDENVTDNVLINDLKEILLNKTIIEVSNPFKIITKFYSKCGFTDESKKVCAKILKCFFEDIGEEKTLNLLDEIDSKENFFWSFLGILGLVLGMYPLSPEFASKWFLKLINIIKDDLASGQFYNGIEDYSYNFSSLSIQVLSLLLKEELNQVDLSLSALILGSIRANLEFSKDKIFINMENSLKCSCEYKKRIIYYKSYSFTFNKTGLSLSKFKEILREINKEIDEIKEQQYYLFERVISYNSTNRKLINSFLDSINKTQNNISEIGQYNILASLKWIVEKLKVLNDNNLSIELNTVLRKVLPISIKNRGTWKLVENYLLSLYEYNHQSFNEAFIILIDFSYEEFEQIFYEEFAVLEQTLRKESYNEYIFHLLISEKRKKRKFGFSLSQRLGLTISDNIINSELPVYKLRLLLYSTALYCVASEKIGDFMLTIEPLYRKIDPTVKNEFIQEMIFQAINFPGAALDKWKKFNNKSEILQNVIDIAGKYFDNFHKTDSLPANSYFYSDVMKGENQWIRKTSNSISKGAKEKSVFLKYVRTTNLLYGNLWAIYNYQEPIKEPSALKLFSQTYEFPSLEISDPEGMVIRRMNLNKKIRDLQNE